ncbi:hypothetical protein Tco_0886805 [Tanacetum coccineum]
MLCDEIFLVGYTLPIYVIGNSGFGYHPGLSVLPLHLLLQLPTDPPPKDFITRRVLLRCDSTGELYPVLKSSTIPHAFLSSQYTWHQRLGHPGSKVLTRHVLVNLFLLVIEEKLLMSMPSCQLGDVATYGWLLNSSRTPDDTESIRDGEGTPLLYNLIYPEFKTKRLPMLSSLSSAESLISRGDANV